MESTRNYQDNLPKVVVHPQDHRAVFSRKRARFSLNPTTSQLEICGGMNLKKNQLQDPEEVFMAIEKIERAEKLQKLSSDFTTDSSQHMLSNREQVHRSGFSGMKADIEQHFSLKAADLDESHASGLDDMAEGMEQLEVARREHIPSGSSMVSNNLVAGDINPVDNKIEVSNHPKAVDGKMDTVDPTMMMENIEDGNLKALDKENLVDSSMMMKNVHPSGGQLDVLHPVDKCHAAAEHSNSVQNNQDLHGTINLYVNLPDRVIVAVDSRCTTEMQEPGRTMMILNSDKKTKFKELVHANGIESSVVITAAGSRSRNIDLWKDLESVHAEKKDIDTLSVEIIKSLKRAPRRDKSLKCQLYLSGFSKKHGSLVVMYIEDEFETPKVYASKFQYGAIGSGAKFALYRLKRWADDMDKDIYKCMDNEKIYEHTMLYIKKALLDCIIYDPACGGTLHVIEIKKTTCIKSKYHPLSLMTKFKPTFENNTLLFFNRDDYTVMNYYRLFEDLVEDEWLRDIRDSKGRVTNIVPSCLGEICGAHAFIVNFDSENDKLENGELKNSAEAFFSGCCRLEGCDDQVRGIMYKDNIFVVCHLRYRLLCDIANGTYPLPWGN